MKKHILLIGIIINSLFFISVLCLKNISILLFLLAIYVLPAVVNVISSMKSKNKHTTYILPLITTIYYTIFSYIFMQQPNFINFVSENSKTVGDLNIQINPNLLSLGPIIFVFLINISGIYLSKKLSRREQYASC